MCSYDSTPCTETNETASMSKYVISAVTVKKIRGNEINKNKSY